MIEVTYLTLQGLADRLNVIDQEDTDEQYTSILSLVVLPATAENDPSAVLITKTELIPAEVKAAQAALAAEFNNAEDATPEGAVNASPPEFFAAPAAEDDGGQ